MRSFAKNTDRSDLVIRHRKTKQIVGRVKPHKFRSYQSNESRTLAKAINR